MPFEGNCGRPDCPRNGGGKCYKCLQQINEAVYVGRVEYPPAHFADISSAASELLAHLLDGDPARRFAAAEISYSAWLRSQRETAVDTETEVEDPRYVSHSFSSDRPAQPAVWAENPLWRYSWADPFGKSDGPNLLIEAASPSQTGCRIDAGRN